jgi:hypothetical protein
MMGASARASLPLVDVRNTVRRRIGVDVEERIGAYIIHRPICGSVNGATVSSRGWAVSHAASGSLASGRPLGACALTKRDARLLIRLLNRLLPELGALQGVKAVERLTKSAKGKAAGKEIAEWLAGRAKYITVAGELA